MARTRKSTAENPAENTEAVNPEVPEESGTVSENTEPIYAETAAAVSETSSESVPASAEVTAEGDANTEAPAKLEVDLEPFKAAVATAVATRDTSTGTLPKDQIENVKTIYRESLEGAKAKGAAKKHLADGLRDAINVMDVVLGKAYMELADEMAKAGTAAKAAAEKAPTDPTDAYVQRIALLNLAYNLAYADRPEGVDEAAARGKAEALVGEHNDKAEAYYTWLQKPADERGDEPDVDTFVKKAVKAALGKVISAGTSGRGGGGSVGGPRRDVAKHIQEAFADQPENTFMLIAEIAKFRSSEYPEGDVSPGAVSARLFPSSGKMTVEGVRPGENESGKRGAFKLAA